MSIIKINIKYDQQLWTEMQKGDCPTYRRSWGSHSVSFSSVGLSISCSVHIPSDQKIKLVESLAKNVEQRRAPHWQELTPDLHNTMLSIEREVLSTASFVDN